MVLVRDEFHAKMNLVYILSLMKPQVEWVGAVSIVTVYCTQYTPWWCQLLDSVP